MEVSEDREGAAPADVDGAVLGYCCSNSGDIQ